MASNRPHTLKDQLLANIPTRRREPVPELEQLNRCLARGLCTGPEWYRLSLETANRIAQARDEQWRAEHEECSCQPNLPDGRQSSPTCPVCRAEEKEIPF